ncbi:ABC transporter ATP-binding protein [candidate division WOR-3 bacterium]|nr:ABC transporter ATP-binding protein [candidate division WOR-3 bacterium]
MNAVEINDLKKNYSRGFIPKKINALNGLSFSVKAGCIYGLLGPNGAGKSTTMKILTGLVRKDGGSAEIFSKPAGTMESKKMLGFLPENPVFYSHLTGCEFLQFSFDLIGKKPEKSRTRLLLESVGIAEVSGNQIKTYSKGMLQRLGIAQAIAGEPELLILDEPLSGVDPVGRTEIKEIIRDLKNRGKTVVISTHTLPDIEELADDIGIIDQGRLILGDSLFNITSKYRKLFILVVEKTDGPPRSSQTDILYTNCGENLWKTEGERQDLEKEIFTFKNEKINIIKFGPSLSPLEQTFVSLIGKT